MPDPTRQPASDCPPELANPDLAHALYVFAHLDTLAKEGESVLALVESWTTRVDEAMTAYEALLAPANLSDDLHAAIARSTSAEAAIALRDSMTAALVS